MKSAVIGTLLAVGLCASAAEAESCSPKSFSHFVVVDQFGYTPAMAKIAVIRSPVAGFDAKEKFLPGSHYEVVDVASCKTVYTGDLSPWHDGAVYESAGDKAWTFDFSAFKTPGRYVIRDQEKNEVSGVFEIAENPYREALKQAVRYFYYQRANTPKDARFAGAAWADGADHIGPRQDTAARHLMKKDDPSSERDLTGGWWDAGDYNRYTNWHADYLISLLHSYVENPSVFTDDFNIPESGNGIPDLIDEVKWGMDWLVKMQNRDGAVLAILGSGFSGSPPSSATNPSYYGGPSTSASYSAAAAFAYGAKILGQFPAYEAYARDLRKRAKAAYDWAEAHPNVLFFNKAAAFGDQALGGGEQEYSPEERPMRALLATIYLFDLTGEAGYHAKLQSLAEQSPLLGKGRVQGSDATWLQPLLYYTTLKSAHRDLVEKIHAHFLAGFRSASVYGAEKTSASPYQAYLTNFTWGSTKQLAWQGFFFLNPTLDHIKDAPPDADTFAAHYLHYLHGVNPLAKVYLSNMYEFGAENSADEFYHAWFAKDSPWQNVKTSKFGPPPGFLVGGPNPSYSWEAGCPALSEKCGKALRSPPYGQPPEKSYADFGDGWPVDSWQVTEPSNGYQVEYIRLLAHFVRGPEVK